MSIENEVIIAMGRFPNAINPKQSIFNQGKWICRRCGRIKPSAGSCECGEVVFIKEEIK